MGLFYKHNNPHINCEKRGVRHFMKWFSGGYKEEVGISPPEGFAYPMPIEDFSTEEPIVSWIGHSTFLVQYEGINILTDPIWSKRCSPVPFAGPKRQHAPPMKIAELPPIDLVLISHNHYDHLDKKTVKELYTRFPHIIWMVPRGVKRWFIRNGMKNVIEKDWWEHCTLSLSDARHVTLHMHCVPTQHFSGRALVDKNATHWSGWVIQFDHEGVRSKQFYFVGDTGYNEKDFNEIGERFGGFDLTLIPIGTYIPRQFMAPVHICPDSAVKIHQEVNSKLSIGMHWKTFRLSSEHPEQPPYDLFQALQKAKVSPHSFRVLEPGQTINW